MEQVCVGRLAQQRAPVVDHDELRVPRRAGAHHLVHVGAQGGALTGPSVAEDQPVRLGVGVDADGPEGPLVDAEEEAAGRLVVDLVEQLGRREPVGEQPVLA